MAAEELAAVLGGGGWPVGAAGGSDPGASEPARLRGNVCYVVLAVLLNEKAEVLVVQEAKAECRGRWYLPAGRVEPGESLLEAVRRVVQEAEVLVVQEAKAECHGRWYLPAGRVEPGESLLEAVRREVQEESGLQCRPLTLLAVEERGPAWVRFVFLARPTGGSLKTLQAADAESLQALWWDPESPALPLRSQDILPLMDLALQYRAGPPRHPPVLPVELPCASVCQRFLLVFTGGNDSLWVLLDTTGGPHLPLAVSSPRAPSKPGRRLVAALPQLLRRCLARPETAVRHQGLLGLQHLGQDPGQSDGVCFNVVATVGNQGSQQQEPAPPALQEPAFSWWEVEDAALKGEVLRRLRTASFLPIYS